MGSAELFSLLDVIQQQTLRVSALALAVYLYKFRKLDSFTIVLALMCCADLLHMGAENGLYLLYESHPELAKRAWYFTFAFADFLFAFAAYKACDMANVNVGKIARVMMLTYLFLGFCQLIRYADRFLINTDALGGFYSAITPAVNSCIAITVLIYTLITVFSYSNKS